MKRRRIHRVDIIMQAAARVDDARAVIERLSVDDERFEPALDEFEAALAARSAAESAVHYA